MNLAVLRALDALPVDVVFSNIVPRLLLDEPGEEEVEPGEIIRDRKTVWTSSTPRDVLVLVCDVMDNWYDSHASEVRFAMRDALYASLLRIFHSSLLDQDLRVHPRPTHCERLFLTDCAELCSTLHPHPTLQWEMREGIDPQMATTLLASPTGSKVVLRAEKIRIRGNSLYIFLRAVEGMECVKASAMSTDQAAVASLALVARRGGSRPRASYGELVLGKNPGSCCYQQTRDALEATRFTMSEIKSLSSTTMVSFKNEGRDVVVELIDVLSSLGGSDGEIMLTVGACFVGLDLVEQHAFYPVRLNVLEDIVRARAKSGQVNEAVFSRMNRMDCDIDVLKAWEKRMFV